MTELRDTIVALKADLRFGDARRLLEAERNSEPRNEWALQQLALCTYKDEELHPEKRFAKALAILDEIGLRDPNNTNAETLALGGAIFKRKWEYQGLIEDLFRALAFYRAAFKRNPRADQGYGGVNAAYILELLASRARIGAVTTGVDGDEAERLQVQARSLREEISGLLASLLSEDPTLVQHYWYVATVAENALGLRHYDIAATNLQIASTLEPPEWQLETTFRQLLEILRLQGLATPKFDQPERDWPEAWRALAQLLGSEATSRALGCHRGKVGLALSGGGFRASFYHLGVLARLAEMDVLRSVDVLSTVSGGSIVGAHYYLALQALLERNTDSTITAADYVDIVRRVQHDVLTGVASNLRMRAFANLAANIRMIFSKKYTRSHRLGELYEKHLYRHVGMIEGEPSPRHMTDLLVQPAGQEGKNFKPKLSNWRRRSHVPVLLINTTSLNSGHNWFFTASWMGEPPGLQGTEVDVNRRYRRLYYRQAPTDDLKHYRLGYAVAASSCVPGMFPPLTIPGLYDDHLVRLVDGGVHDNQGTQGLLDEGCSLILCSDASGQMGDTSRPPDGTLGVPLRSNSILMDRVREAQYQDLKSRVDSRALRGLFFVHLQEGLHHLPINWIGHNTPVPDTRAEVASEEYGIPADIQEKIASIRTDLDSFTEVEAYSLMLSGYLMTEWKFRQLQKDHTASGEIGATWGDFNVEASRGDWAFLKLEPILAATADDPQRKDLGRQLAASNGRMFKVFKLIPSLAVLGGLVALLLLVGAVWAAIELWDNSLTLRIGSIVTALLISLALSIWPILKWFNPQWAVRGVLRKTAVALAGFVVAQAHLLLLNPPYLKRGKLKRLLQRGA